MTAMSEADARQKWCPFVRSPSATNCDGSSAAGAVSANRDYGGDYRSGQRCIGSKCMAWRWHVAPYPEFTNALGEACRAFEGSGYCGLAGAP